MFEFLYEKVHKTSSFLVQLQDFTKDFLNIHEFKIVGKLFSCLLRSDVSNVGLFWTSS